MLKIAQNHRDRARAADDGIGHNFYIILSWIAGQDARKQGIYGSLSLRSPGITIVGPQRPMRLLWTVQRPTKNEEADWIDEMYEERSEKVLEEKRRLGRKPKRVLLWRSLGRRSKIVPGSSKLKPKERVCP